MTINLTKDLDDRSIERFLDWGQKYLDDEVNGVKIATKPNRMERYIVTDPNGKELASIEFNRHFHSYRLVPTSSKYGVVDTMYEDVRPFCTDLVRMIKEEMGIRVFSTPKCVYGRPKQFSNPIRKVTSFNYYNSGDGDKYYFYAEVDRNNNITPIDYGTYRNYAFDLGKTYSDKGYWIYHQDLTEEDKKYLKSKGIKTFGTPKFVTWLNEHFGKDLDNLDEVQTQIVKDRNGKNVYLVNCPLSNGNVYSWCYEVNGLLGKPNVFKDVNSFKASLYPLGIKTPVTII